MLQQVGQMMGQAMAQQSVGKSRTSDLDLIAAFFDRDRAGALKRVMAEQFADADGMMAALEGPDGRKAGNMQAVWQESRGPSPHRTAVRLRRRVLDVRDRSTLSRVPPTLA